MPAGNGQGVSPDQLTFLSGDPHAVREFNALASDKRRMALRHIIRNVGNTVSAMAAHVVQQQADQPTVLH